MLDSETKRRIDTARDILVGKVPDPKSQVEQITIALIYKFMDDMDAESEELGGERKFFAGEFAKYGWAKLMRSGVGGHEMLGLYGEAITRMPENPGIPPLFRGIFKNAYLPYRDPETLRSFLKIINDFNYDHSERLGDAFEYLLSVLGSQGDAGQFRTPRHIIDFIVSIVDPKKDETVLDPACGTAGFLISSYKHILAANRDADGNSTLTPDDRGRLAGNFTGYDISPDMVRLSLVNMYLHGFTDPHISEYDTLTSQDRWNEYADVILANPPFMSPKGGIKPHNRFSVQSKRSEVLFVDYMAEHLTPNGRAGIIVPEGVIFQGGTAYRQLRKLLVEESLLAVVSLPAGVFNPYSGVKTSVLILNRALARESETIGFFGVSTDGFGLGAQRRPIEEDDLPQVRKDVQEYVRLVSSRLPTDQFETSLGLAVPKEAIAASGDYNLSVERYRRRAHRRESRWPVVALGELCTFMTGGTPSSLVPDYYHGGTVPWMVSGDVHQTEIRDCEKRITLEGVKNSNARILPRNSVLIALNGQGKTRGTVALLRMDGATCNQSLVAMTPVEPKRILPEFLFLVLRAMYSELRALTGDNQRSGLTMSLLRKVEVPLPPLDVQRDVVAEIEAYQAIVTAAYSIVDQYKPRIPVDPTWEVVELGDLGAFASGGTPAKAHEAYWIGDIPWISAKDMKTDRLDGATLHVSEQAVLDRTTRLAPAGSILVLVRGMGLANGVPVCLATRPCAFNQDVKAVFPHRSRVVPAYLATLLGQSQDQFVRIMQTAAHGTLKLSTDDLRRIEIPLAPLDVQMKIVTGIDRERQLVAASSELIDRFDAKIRSALGSMWNSPLR